MPVFDSRNRQGNVRFPYNAATLVAFTILFTTKLVVKLDWYNTLSKLKIYCIYALEVMLSNFKKTLYLKIFVCWPYSLTACRKIH